MGSREIAAERARELVAKMTLEERASQLKYDAPPIRHLNVPAYNWWNEALHGVARAGTATSFPQAIGMAAMFDEEMLQTIADTIATEGRAKYNAYSAQNDRDIYKGLTFWSPNINIFRDPRWGRGHETYGEDPYLTTRLGLAFIKGLQGEGDVMKTAACAKHYAVHSGPEAIRHEFDAQVTDKDLWETYLPAFEACVVEGKVESVMGAYNRTNSEPCCGSYFLLRDVLRGKWGFQGHVVSDCWAIKDFHENHRITKNARESTALAIKAGCDLNCGNTYLHIMAAHQEGLVTEADITQAAERLFTTRFLLGLFDETEFDEIPYQVVECKAHLDLALDAARKSAVLLKNSGVLPLDKTALKSIGVIGPNANNRVALVGNYHGTATRYTTVLEGIQDEVGEDVRVYYSEGSHLFSKKVEGLAWDQDRISEAITVAEMSDVVVLCLGLDETMEGEEMDQSNHVGSGDKADLKLPVVQQELLERVAAVGKPTILCLMAGSAIDLNFADENLDGVLLCWYPGASGGKAIADLLFGKYSPSGKLPVTFYKDLEGMPAFEDYTMKNRTYRYIEKEALYPFGYGLTYSDIQVMKAHLKGDAAKGQPVHVEVEIGNNSMMATDEVIQVYIKDMKSTHAVRNTSLCSFNRIHLNPGETKTIELVVDEKAFTIVDEKGARYIDGDSFILYVGTSQPDGRSVVLTGKKPMEVKIEL